MVWSSAVASSFGVVTLLASCSIFTDLDGLQSATDGGGATQDASTGIDAAASDAATESGIAIDSGTDASSCACTNVVSAYRFSDPSNLGKDFFGHNNMTAINGTPKQSAITPNGLPGNSIQLDGSS